MHWLADTRHLCRCNRLIRDKVIRMQDWWIPFQEKLEISRELACFPILVTPTGLQVIETKERNIFSNIPFLFELCSKKKKKKILSSYKIRTKNKITRLNYSLKHEKWYRFKEFFQLKNLDLRVNQKGKKKECIYL